MHLFEKISNVVQIYEKANGNRYEAKRIYI